MSSPRRKKLAPPPAPPSTLRNEAGDVVGVQWSMRLSGSQNSREHYQAKARRVKAERGAALAICRSYLVKPTSWPVTVRLTRVGPGKPDDDAIPQYLKGVRDGVADFLGVNDGDRSKVRFEYSLPERGAYAVRVEFVDVAAELEANRCAEWKEVLGA